MERCPYYSFEEYKYDNNIIARIPVCIGQKYMPEVDCGGDRNSKFCAPSKMKQKSTQTWYDHIHNMTEEELADFLEIYAEGAKQTKISYTYQAILASLKEDYNV